MNTLVRSRSLAGGATALFFALAANADRPSLLDLQSKLTQVVDGLCAGDPRLCGAQPVPAAVGQLIFDPDGPEPIVLSLVSLDLTVDSPLNCTATTCQRASIPTYVVNATVQGSEATAALLEALVQRTPFPAAHVVVPDPEGGGNVNALQLANPQVLELGPSTTASGHNEISFQAADRVRYTWRSTSSEWNFGTNSGAGCTVPSGERHVELSGNSSSALQSGEAEAAFGASFAAEVRPNLVVVRTPPNACHLRSSGATQMLRPVYDRLWTRDGEFSGRQSVETLLAAASWASSWTLRVRSGVLSEEIELILLSGELELRTFDERTGDEVSNTTTPIGF